MKKLLLVLVVMLLLFTSCEYDNTAEEEQQRQTDAILEEINAQVGMPAIVNYQEKKLAKLIFELRDRADLVTYAYIVNMQGGLVFIGECVGYGLPYSVQYTSPEKLVNVNSTDTIPDFVLPQADPNGLYMPEGLSATWLMMLDRDTGEVKPVYVEPEIIVSPFKLH